MKKKLVFTCCIALFLAAIIVTVCLLRSPISGDKILQYMRFEDITSVSIKKTQENGASVILGKCELTDSEVAEFYDGLSNSTFREHKGPGLIQSEIRYYATFTNKDGNAECTMVFYDDDFLLFEYSYGDRPGVSKRYEIISTELNRFFESVIK